MTVAYLPPFAGACHCRRCRGILAAFLDQGADAAAQGDEGRLVLAADGDLFAKFIAAPSAGGRRFLARGITKAENIRWFRAMPLLACRRSHSSGD